ncbi:pilus assembly PilX family protein [Pseudoxanthomonas suwonensis]|nr:PilX N-terminal domain-containing pilus assembly protein [Pseudoxanthomonas suwonensis]
MALMILVLLALIGIVGMQVAGLQERMSANYRSANLAFQNAEEQARLQECALEDLVNRTSTVGCPPVSPDQFCDNGFDPAGWAQGFGMAGGAQTNARLIGPCISGNTSVDMGAPVNEDPNPIYQVTVYATDMPANPAADAAIDIIFRP